MNIIFGYFFKADFWKNPQFQVKLTDVDKDDNENMATLIVALMQKDSRLKRRENYGEAAEEYIQFRLFKVFNILKYRSMLSIFNSISYVDS